MVVEGICSKQKILGKEARQLYQNEQALNCIIIIVGGCFIYVHVEICNTR